MLSAERLDTRVSGRGGVKWDNDGGARFIVIVGGKQFAVVIGAAWLSREKGWYECTEDHYNYTQFRIPAVCYALPIALPITVKLPLFAALEVRTGHYRSL